MASQKKVCDSLKHVLLHITIPKIATVEKDVHICETGMTANTFLYLFTNFMYILSESFKCQF